MKIKASHTRAVNKSTVNLHFCDIYFRASFDIIKEHDYLNKIIDRIPYSNPDTKNKMETIRTRLTEFIHHAHGCEEI